jgi:hypothetical protein
MEIEISDFYQLFSKNTNTKIATSTTMTTTGTSVSWEFILMLSTTPILPEGDFGIRTFKVKEHGREGMWMCYLNFKDSKRAAAVRKLFPEAEEIHKPSFLLKDVDKYYPPPLKVKALGGRTDDRRTDTLAEKANVQEVQVQD